MTDLKVAFPKPCDAAWEDMAQRGCNRHCASCDKIIHDLAALTLDEAEALLSAEDEVCVRAQVGHDGVIALKPSSTGTARRMVAAAGASLALAAAACQTVPDNAEPRFEITGEFTDIELYSDAQLTSADGRQWPKRRVPGKGRFIFSDLPPGVYTLTTEDACGMRLEIETITISDSSIEARIEYPAGGCIIVGAMVKVERPERA